MKAILFGTALLSVSATLAQTGPAAPDPAATAPGTLGMATGFDRFRWEGDLQVGADIAAYAALGARWFRTDLNWAVVQEAGPQSFNWAPVDRVVNRARAAGLEVMLVAGGTPVWARVTPAVRSTPADPAAYARFLARAVERYAPRGIRVWEIWNEPNVDGPWPPSPDPVAYTRLLKAAYPAVKAADPEALVLSGGLSPVVETGPATGRRRFHSAVDFLRVIYAEGGGAFFDGLAFHPYSYPRLPGDPVDWSGWSMMTGPIRDMMVAQGDGGKPVWITEYGAPTGGQGAVSEAVQAPTLRDAVRLAAGYPWAGPLFWYSHRDLGTDPTDREDWFGLLRHDESPKPARDAFRETARDQALRAD